MNEDPATGRVLTPVPPAKPSALKRLAEIEARLPAATDVVLLGDSLAAGFPAELHAQAFDGCRVLNLGLPGDRVQNTLWRLDRLKPGRLAPAHLILLLGTNNLGDGDPAGAILAGLTAVLAKMERIWVGTRFVVVTVPRRGEMPGFREGDRLTLNAALARDLVGSGRTVVIDADAALAHPAGEEPSLLPDLLHLSPAGYSRLASAFRASLLASDR